MDFKWHKVFNIKSQKKKIIQNRSRQKQSKDGPVQKLEVWSGVMEEWTPSADRSNAPCAFCLNRENGKIRRHFGDLLWPNHKSFKRYRIYLHFIYFSEISIMLKIFKCIVEGRQFNHYSKLPFNWVLHHLKEKAYPISWTLLILWFYNL